MATSTRLGNAVVVGAGMAGLTAARALADRFDSVTVVDRDRLPDAAVPRRGASQGAHGHVLPPAGERAPEELFPALHADLPPARATSPSRPARPSSTPVSTCACTGTAPPSTRRRAPCGCCRRPGHCSS